jgi:hypothetical protein
MLLSGFKIYKYAMITCIEYSQSKIMHKDKWNILTPLKPGGNCMFSLL